VNTVGTTVMGMWLAGFLWNWQALALIIWSTLPFNLLIYGVNDIFDQETDSKNTRKGGLEGALILASESKKIVLGVLLLNIPFLIYFFFTYSAATLIWITAYVVIFVFYSAPPFRFKARKFFDSFSNAAYAFPMVFVPLALGEEPIWFGAIGLMAWSMAKHTYDAIQDIDEDLNSGIVTTAVYLKPRGVVYWSGFWWLVSTIGFWLVNIPVAIVNGLVAGYLLFAVWRKPTLEAGRAMYKYSIAFPYIAGAVAGIQVVTGLLLGFYP
jgi:4-hydroxybenzoate polyprenyltransferase